MGDAENSLPPSKKRAAGREISKENPGLDDEEDSAELESGTFKRASDEVLATRRIVKVRRNQNTSTPSSNPFAGIRLVPPTEPTTAPAVVIPEVVATSEKVSEDGKNNGCEGTEKGKDGISKLSDSKIDEPVDETAAGIPEKGVAETAAPGTDEKDETETATLCAEKKAEAETATLCTGKKCDAETSAPSAEKKAEAQESAENAENNNIVNQAIEPKVNTEKPAEDDKSGNKNSAGCDKTEDEDKKDSGHGNVDSSVEGAQLSSFQRLSSSQNAFTGLAGTGFSTSSFSFGSIPKDGSTFGTGPGSLFGQKNDQPSFGFGLSSNGSSSLFNTTGSSIVSKSEGIGFPSMQEVTVETGEENERVVFSADSALFEFLDVTWKERGKGEVKVNVSTSGAERARLVMRTRGNYRLILNASLYPDMKLTNMDKRGITFACMNSTGEDTDGKNGLSTFALKFKDVSIVEEFRSAVTEHKGKTATVLKTPENSPKASNE